MPNLRILSVETSVGPGSIAVLAGRRLLDSVFLSPDEKSTRSFATAIASLLQRVGWSPSDVELVSVAVGPGSFTGLRIAVTAAKTFAYAVKAEILGVSTLLAIGHRAPSEVGSVHVALDAHRGELFCGRCQRNAAGAMTLAVGPGLQPADRWLDHLQPGDLVAGPALVKLASKLPASVKALSPECWRPTAAAVGQIAAADFEAGRRDDLWRLAPLYLRQSAAEEKAAREL